MKNSKPVNGPVFTFVITVCAITVITVASVVHDMVVKTVAIKNLASLKDAVE